MSAVLDLSKLCAEKSQALHQKYHALFKGMFMETSPIPLKAAMEMMNLIDSGATRLPLCPISAGGKEKLAALLKSYGLV